MLATCIVIPVHNRRAVTLRCLETLAADGVFGWATVLVIDDGSTDGTDDAVRAAHPSAVVLTGDGNLWWGGAMRLGMEHAHRAGAACVCWLNDDCRPEPGTLRLLADHARDTGGLATGWAVTPSGGHYGGYRKTRRGMVPVPVPPPGGSVPCDAAGGNCVAIARPVIDAVGLPDAARLPHALLDLDYLLGATRRGFPLVMLGSARCRNDDNLSRAASSWLLDDAPPWQQWRVFLGRHSTHGYVASFHFHRKHWGMAGLWIIGREYLKLAAICLLRLLIPLRWLRSVYGARSATWKRHQFYRQGESSGPLPTAKK